jgi:hypothetical protein
MHVLSACGWISVEALPPAGGGGGRLHPEARAAADDFVRRAFKRVRATDSDEEHSDEDVC